MLSQGPFTYNRFDVLNEKAKPDFLDMDKDGDKKESMKKAIKDKDGKCDKCGKKDCGCDDKKDDKGKPPWLKKEEVEIVYPMDELEENRFAAHGGKDTDAGAKYAKPSKGSGKGKTYTMTGKDGKPLFSEGNCNSKGKKKVVKEDVLQYMLENNYVNNEVSAEVLFNHMSDEFLEALEDDIMELYVGKHGQTEKQYQDGRSPAGKMISGDSKGSGANYSYGAKNTGTNPAGGSQKPQGQARMNNKDRAFLKMQKANMGSKKKGY